MDIALLQQWYPLFSRWSSCICLPHATCDQVSTSWCDVHKQSQLLHSQFSSVQFSRSVVSDSLRPHELQHARPPGPSPTPRIHPNHVHWVCDAIQPSHPLLSPSPALNLSQQQGLFQWVSIVIIYKTWDESLNMPSRPIWSCLTLYVQSIFCDVPLANNTDPWIYILLQQ